MNENDEQGPLAKFMDEEVGAPEINTVGLSSAGPDKMETNETNKRLHNTIKSPVDYDESISYTSISVGNYNDSIVSEPPARKRLKMDEAISEINNVRCRLIDHKTGKIKMIRERYAEMAAELFFLRAGGNMIDYPVWRKRPATPHLLNFLKQTRLDDSLKANVVSINNASECTVSRVEASPPHNTETISTNCVATSTDSLPGASAESKNTIEPVINTSPNNAQEHMVEKAKQEAYVVRRVCELQREGLWSEKRLPKVMEPPRTKAHWDYLLEEMAWLAADFAQEKKWKKAAAKKCARMVQKHFQEKAMAAQKAEKAQEIQLRRIASFAAKEIKNFWANVEKLVEFKRNSRLEEQRKKALDQQLSFIVDQTERYSKRLAAGMQTSEALSDDEFKPNADDDDDEETIAAADAEDDKQGGHSKEVEALQRESMMDLDEVLNALPPAYLEERCNSPDYSADSLSEDDERTLDEQEEHEKSDEHEEEIKDLQADAELSVDELRKKYSRKEASLTPSSEIDDSTEVASSSSSDGGMDEEEEQDEEDGEELSTLVDEEGTMDVGAAEEKVRAAAEEAAALQPTGFTLSDTAVATPVPNLIKHTLREYQHVGLHWLATMRSRRLNGILADEMGLGKTIQTIALLAHLAEKGDWGPHLVVVPTSVTLNWEMEFKKWCPAFKILTYYGTIRERKLKRAGWTKPNAFHICIASYKLVVQDHQSFRRKRWSYLILDEAQNIKNFKSQRWQLLLNFQTERRLLLTGTPLQNDLMELWSLMHFLMPSVFASHREFREWFGNPVAGMIEGTAAYNESLIKRLHKVLRPFLLRRLKSEVEKQMPKKYEHVLMCRLSKRQRFLYDDFMSRAKTKETLQSGNLLGVMNVLMQLRKVCNHPNLFEARPIVSPLRLEPIQYDIPSLILIDTQKDMLGPRLCALESLSAFAAHRARHLQAPRRLITELSSEAPRPPSASLRMHIRVCRAPPPPIPSVPTPLSPVEAYPTPSSDGGPEWLEARERSSAEERGTRAARGNELRCIFLPMYGADLREAVTLETHKLPFSLPNSLQDMMPLIDQFTMYVGQVNTVGVRGYAGKGAGLWRAREAALSENLMLAMKPTYDMLHPVLTLRAVSFPHPRLIQYDCGKLQTLDPLLRTLKSESHRVLIFTQMTRMLDVLEAFLTHHGHTYLRLDGATKVDARQNLVERFNADPKIFAFILSTRSGGVGLNLTGADTVVFYDSDWNPTMDAQAQDRCHRIGQTRDVHVYRLVSERTVEENILRKAMQKRALGDITIDAGKFTTSYLRSGDVRSLLVESSIEEQMSSIVKTGDSTTEGEGELERALDACEDEADAVAARTARAEAVAELAEFDESVPLDEETVHHEIRALEDQLTPIERYAMRLVESSDDAVEAERMAAADMERQLQEWEDARKRLQSPQREEEEEDDDITYTRQNTQIWISGTGENMPMWCPPTPPRGSGDVYIDPSLVLLYRTNAAPESALPPARAPVRRPRSPTRQIAPQPVSRIPPRAPRSLFERGVPSRPRPRIHVTPRDSDRARITEWSRAEDAALRLAARLQGLPPDRVSPCIAVIPNWDFAADLVAEAGRAYRSPRQCRDRADIAPSPREELEAAERRHKRGKPSRRGPQTSRTSEDGLRQVLPKIDAMHAALEGKRAAPKRRCEDSATKNPKHAMVLIDWGVDYELPPTPMDIAARRAERIAREKLKAEPVVRAAPSVSTASVAAAAPTQRIVLAPAKGTGGVASGTTVAAPAALLFRQQGLVRHQLKILQQPVQSTGGVEMKRATVPSGVPGVSGIGTVTGASSIVTAQGLPPGVKVARHVTQALAAAAAQQQRKHKLPPSSGGGGGVGGHHPL